MHSPSSIREYLARCSWLLYQDVWAAAPQRSDPGPLAPCLVSRSHRDPFPPALFISSPRAVSFHHRQQAPCSYQSHQWDLLSPPCLLAVLAAILGQRDSYHPSTPPWLPVQWQLLDHRQDLPPAAENWGGQEAISGEGKAADLFRGEQRKGIRNHS